MCVCVCVFACVCVFPEDAAGPITPKGKVSARKPCRQRDSGKRGISSWKEMQVSNALPKPMQVYGVRPLMQSHMAKVC